MSRPTHLPTLPLHCCQTDVRYILLTGRANLVVRPGMLTGGSSYVFRLSATDTVLQTAGDQNSPKQVSSDVADGSTLIVEANVFSWQTPNHGKLGTVAFV